MRNVIIIIFGLIIILLTGKLIYDWVYFGDDARCFQKDECPQFIGCTIPN